MLPAHERHLIAAESALPAMRRVLDPDCVSAWIGANAQRVYVRYRPRAAVIATYRVRGTLLTVETLADPKKLRDKSRGDWIVGELEFGQRTDGEVAYWEYPNDRDLAQASPCKAPLLSYKPHRRIVVKDEFDGMPVVRKFHTRGEYSHYKDTVKGIKPFGALRLQQRVGKDRPSRSIFYRWLDGRQLKAHSDPRTLELVGEALARLHFGKASRLLHQTREHECDALRAAAEFAARLLPECAGRVISLSGALCETLQKRDYKPRPIHGDLKPSQIIVGDEIGLIDFDRSAQGDPAYDIGSLLARCDCDPMIDSYFSAFKEIPNIALQTACAIVRSLPDPFKSGSLAWPAETLALLDRAETTLTDPALPEINDAFRSPLAKLIRHKPGRRAAIDSGAVVTKIRAKGLDEKAAIVYQELNKHTFPFATPRTTRHILHIRAIEFEKLEGVAAEPALFDGDETIAQLAGDALAAMHKADVKVSRQHTIESEMEILQNRLADDPELFCACKAASRRLVATSPAAIHRDFHPGQLLIQPNGRLAILDFDLMAMGDPAIDVGNFAAHLEEAGIRGKSVSGTAIKTFLKSYQGARGPALLDNATIYCALSLARLVSIAREGEDRRAHAQRIRAAALLKLMEGSK
ncbi:MAG: aminoglycoside phosphotransferase family protein [Armatimonadota bacterium]|nr:aminoglycoside phosphotransferase family protein [Armatimonadota bacterium]